MRIKSNAASVIFKLFTVLCIVIGLLLSLGVFEGKLNFSTLKAFTLLSNIFAGVFLIIAAAAAKRGDAGSHPMLRLAVTVSVLLTCLVGHFMLGQFMDPGKPYTYWGIIFLHYIAPILTALDYLLFAKKGLVRWYYPIAGVYPAAIYSLMVMVMVTLGVNWGFGFNAKVGYASRFPYPFMDADLYGDGQVIVTILIMAAAILLAGFVLFGIDRLCAKLQENKKLEP